MIIGFTSRSQTVPEGGSPFGYDLNRIMIDVATERTSERIHTILFRHLESASTATVVNRILGQADFLFDALFGNGDTDPIEESFTLQPGQSVIRSLVTFVNNDFRPEEDECYTIGIFTTDIPGARELFSCNDDEDMANNFSVFIPSALQMMMVDYTSNNFILYKLLLSFRTIRCCICANNVHCC